MINLQQVSFTYEGEQEDGLKEVTLHIKKGEVVLLCGPSGCGKTTLSRLINGLIPHFYNGKLDGNIIINGADQKGVPLYERSRMVGSVFQNPRSQFFSVNTTNELAFGSENRGVEREEIIQRINQTVADLKMGNLMDRNIFELSGGEKQKIACASVSVNDNEIYVLDEPSSNLDVHAIEHLKQQLMYWKEKGKTIIIAEHRLFFLREIADRLIYMNNGEVVGEFSREELKKMKLEESSKLGLRPLHLEDISYDIKKPARDELLVLQDFYFKYKHAVSPALEMGTISVPKYSVIAIIGHNGAGKSTFARCLCGLEATFKGQMLDSSKRYSTKQRLQASYMVMQDVNHQLFTESVLDEILLSMKEEDEEQALQYLQQLDIEALSELHPLSLSGGQKQRVAIASALASNKELLLFDEPTSGLDLFHMKEVSSCIQNLAKMNKTIFLISHDYELIADCCDYVIHLESGKVSEQYCLDASHFEKLRNFFI